MKAQQFNIIVRKNSVKGFRLYSLLYLHLIRSGHRCRINQYERGINVTFPSKFDSSIMVKILKADALNVQEIWYNQNTCTLRVWA